MSSRPLRVALRGERLRRPQCGGCCVGSRRVTERVTTAVELFESADGLGAVCVVREQIGETSDRGRTQ